MSKRPRLGTYVCVDDQLFAHPKIQEVGPIASALYQAGFQYCGNRLTDGFVPSGYVPFLLPPEWLARISVDGEPVELKQLLEQLLQAQLWHVVDGGYVIHDYLDWNLSRADVEHLREQKRQAGQQGGRAKARNRLTSESLAGARSIGASNTVAGARSVLPSKTLANTDTDSRQVNSKVNPLSPEGGVGGDKPSDSTKTSTRRSVAEKLEAEFDEIWAVYPRKTDRLAALKAYKARRRERVTAEDLAAATANYAKVRSGEDPQFTKRGATFFGPSHPWRDYLPGGPGLIEARQSEAADKDQVSEASQAWRAYRRFIADQSVYEFCEFPNERMKFAAYETYGNWREMCESSGRERNEDKAVFLKAWDEFEAVNV